MLVGALALLVGTPTGRNLVRLELPRAVPLIASSTHVAAGGSIAAALRDAQPGTEIVVEPGEYREALVLPEGVRLVSRLPRQAVLRLSGSASDNAAVVTASRIAGAELVGFRIVGDAATPVGTGIYVDHAALRIVDVEISGATNAAIEFDAGSGGVLLGSDLTDNFGSAVIVRAGADPRVSHNRFARNATAERSTAWLILDSGANPSFEGNTFDGLRPDVLPLLKDRNWFIPPPGPLPSHLRAGGRADEYCLPAGRALRHPAGDRSRGHGDRLSGHRYRDRHRRGPETGPDRARPRGARDSRSRRVGCATAGALLAVCDCVPKVFGFWRDGDYFYLAMEYCDGQNLSELLAESLPVERAVSIAIDLCRFSRRRTPSRSLSTVAISPRCITAI